MLNSYDYSLDILIRDHENNIISSGSEFRNTHVLGPFLHSYACPDSFQDILRNGENCEFIETSKEELIENLSKALERGNHKSAESQL